MQVRDKQNDQKPKIQGYEKDNPHDYTKKIQQDGVEIGICEIEGKRQDQEDAISISTAEVASLPLLTDEMIEASFRETFDSIQQQHGNVDTIGTTGLAATAWIDTQTNVVTTWTANLGDSTAFLVILDQNGALKDTIPLNEIHDPGTDEELKRLEAFTFTPKFGKDKTPINIATMIRDDLKNKKPARLPRGLKLARGFADVDAEEYGFSHIAQITKRQVKLENGERAYIVVACDGLTERDVDAKRVGEIVQQNQGQSIEVISEALVNAAYNGGDAENGSGDNISVIVSPIYATPVSMAVFDGHGGTYAGDNEKYKGKTASDLSKEISEAFYPTLRKKILLEEPFEAIKSHYKKLKKLQGKFGIAPHTKNINHLLDRIKAINSDPKINYPDKYQRIIESLEADLLQQVFKGGKENAKANIAMINNEPNDHHYTRLLAITYLTLSNDPRFRGTTKIGELKSYVNQIALPDNPIYTSMLSQLLTPENNDQLEKLKTSINKEGVSLTDTQLYRLMKGQDSLDDPLVIRRLFPDLTKDISAIGMDPLIVLRDGDIEKANEIMQRTQVYSDDIGLGLKLNLAQAIQSLSKISSQVAVIRNELNKTKSSLEIETEEKMRILRTNVFLALDHYTNKINRKSHYKDFNNLYKKIDAISLDLTKTSNERYELMVKELIKAYQKEQRPAFLSRAILFKKTLNSLEFVGQLNNNDLNNVYHYPREIGAILKAVYENENNNEVKPNWFIELSKLNVNEIKHNYEFLVPTPRNTELSHRNHN